MPGMQVPLDPIVALVLVAYLVYAVWSAYTTGVNRGMMKKHGMKGIVQYGPYLSLLVSFAGIALVIFITYELVAYYGGFIRADLPANLANLDFLTFFINQFSSVRLVYRIYVIFLAVGLVVSCTISFFAVLLLYEKGVEKAEKTGTR